ncbi:MAG: peptidase U32 family protein [Candidatus Cloacimonadales bacterium]|nr:peptidase U32 family protein [Candidatus Cloacimonadales bacterium]
MQPELLLPVGNTESFYAALEGGADAVYFGLRNFNARGRAKNFAPNQMQSLIKEAGKNNLKTYLTLNTLIKNSELSTLLDTLYMISQTGITALIIQDLGVLYILKNFFPKFPYQASTQMGIHNSAGTEFARQNGFERVILARELTFSELQEISRKSQVQLEIFAHGALCYSFSGMCLFSSYLGGMSANRGLCRQPCRRIFSAGNKAEYFFSLKDNQQIELIPQLAALNISSIKIEGRMKSAEYVYQTARAYRMAIDDPAKIEKAKKILNFDLGRQKTSYFLGGNVSHSITDDPFTGNLIGTIDSIETNGFTFKTEHRLEIGNRVRVQPQNGKNSSAIKIKNDNFTTLSPQRAEDSETTYKIDTETGDYQAGDNIFLAGLGQKKFSSKFALTGKKLQLRMPEQRKNNILQKIGSQKIPTTEQLFLRINHLDWLRKIFFDKFDFLILNLTKNEWQQLDLRSAFLQKILHKIIVQLPKFIPENDLDFYRNMTAKLTKMGVSHFMLSHISQKQLFSSSHKVAFCSSENVYVLNDIAVQFLKEEQIKFYIYPFENDFPNLLQGKDRKGIVPLYFYPELFYSRLPALQDGQKFQDDKNTYQKLVRDGITCIIPDIPVSLLQYRHKLQEKGFRRFLLDLSYEKPSQNTFNRLLKKFHSSSAEQPGTQFNFKMGLQ